MVPDCSIDPFRLCVLNAYTSRHRGGDVLTHHEVIEIKKKKGVCVGVKARERLTAQIRRSGRTSLLMPPAPWGNREGTSAALKSP